MVVKNHNSNFKNAFHIAEGAYKGVKEAQRKAKEFIRKHKQKQRGVHSSKSGAKRLNPKARGGPLKVLKDGASTENKAFTYKMRAMKKSQWNITKQITNRCNYLIDGTFSVVSTESTQALIAPSGFPAIADLQNCYTRWVPYKNSTTGTNITAIAFDANASSVQLRLDYINAKFEFTNSSPGNSTVDVYICMSKVTKPAYVDPGVDWASAQAQDQGFAAGNSAIQTQIGEKPTSHKFFNMNWKVLKFNRYSLTSGQTAKLNIRIQVKRIIDFDYWKNYAQIRGFTFAPLFVTRGQVADNANTFAAGNIGITPSKIVATTTLNYQGAIVSPYPKVYWRETSTLHTGDANLYMVEEKTGAVVNADLTTNY